jgi:hypothetical protein
MRKLIHSSLSTALSAALVMLIGLSGVSSTALAVAPSNSPLSITVTVTHSEDTAGTEAGRVYFEVNLSPAPLMLIAEPPSQSVLEGDPITYNYTAISTANGPDSYTLIVQSQTPTNVDGNIGSFVVTPNTLSLGATAASGPVAAGTLEIPVLSDGVADNSINGIEAGDTVYIQGQAHTVDVVEDQPLEETSVIHLTEAHDTAIGVGDMISEGASFELVVSGVTIADLENDATVGVLITATSEADNDQSTQDETLTTVFAPIPASTEYWVRNVTNPNGEGDAGYATADQSYYGTDGQVKASAEDVLEYIIVQSAGNTGDLNDVVIRSSMPLFTTYIGNSTYLNGQEQADPPADPAQSLLIAGLDAGTIVRNGQANVTFRVLVDAIPEPDQGGQDQGTQPSTGARIVEYPEIASIVSTWNFDEELNAAYGRNSSLGVRDFTGVFGWAGTQGVEYEGTLTVGMDWSDNPSQGVIVKVNIATGALIAHQRGSTRYYHSVTYNEGTQFEFVGQSDQDTIDVATFGE